jgi:general secretion pathway protein N
MRNWMLRSISGILAVGWLPPCAYAATAPVQNGLTETRLTPFVNTEVKPRQSGKQGSQTGNPLWAIPLESLSSTRERPLFSPSRRPPAQAIAAPPPPRPRPAPVVPEQLQLTLVGTVIGGNEHIGVFLDNATKDVVRLQVGQGVAGWTLSDVQARTATFEKDQRQTMLELPSRNGRQESPPQILTNKPAPRPLPAARRGTPHRRTRPPDTSKRESSVPVASTHDGSGAPTSSGTWRDGDGQLISPPKSPVPVVNAADTPAAGGAANWTDGDGEMIAPPPSYPAANDGRLPAPKAANWRDGDGQMIQPPVEPTGYGGGRWVDGDGQFVSPPSR